MRARMVVVSMVGVVGEEAGVDVAGREMSRDGMGWWL
jgi:hypothetical protein